MLFNTMSDPDMCMLHLPNGIIVYICVTSAINNTYTISWSVFENDQNTYNGSTDMHTRPNKAEVYAFVSKKMQMTQ